MEVEGFFEIGSGLATLFLLEQELAGVVVDLGEAAAGFDGIDQWAGRVVVGFGVTVFVEEFFEESRFDAAASQSISACQRFFCRAP